MVLHAVLAEMNARTPTVVQVALVQLLGQSQRQLLAALFLVSVMYKTTAVDPVNVSRRLPQQKLCAER